VHREIYFKPKNYSTAGPLSCFFVTSGLPQDVEIVGANIDLQRRRLQAVPEKDDNGLDLLPEFLEDP
jgi:hypothetical protein